MGMAKLWDLLRAAAGMDIMNPGTEDASPEARATASAAPKPDARPMPKDASHA